MIKYNHYYKLKSFLNRIVMSAIFSHGFRHYGSRSNIYLPENIIGEEYISIGENVYIGYRCSIIARKRLDIDPLIIIGNNTKIRPLFHAVCIGKIDIGSDVMIADKVFISDCNHEYGNINIPISRQPLKYISPVVIGSESWIGENVCIIGASVGAHSVIGANSVVLHDIPDYSLAVGSPARVVKQYNKETDTWVKA